MNPGHHKMRNYLRKNFRGFFLEDELLAAHTWYKIGGPANFFVYPQSRYDLVALLNKCRSLEIPTYFWGDGSNILAADSGFRGVVVNLIRFFNHIERNDDFVEAEAGAMLQDLVLFCEQRSLGGLEYLSGIPGTVGGALFMNAGTNRGEIGDRVSEVYLLNEQLEPEVMTNNHISFEYRSVPKLKKKLILGCKIKLYYEKESILRKRRLDQIKERSAKQPLEYPSCGSVFKRPPNHFVGKMVEELGLKGLRYGDAMIPEKHGGFIVNLGNAKASHVMFLIEKVQDEVYKSFAVQLEPEVKFVGL